MIFLARNEILFFDATPLGLIINWRSRPMVESAAFNHGLKMQPLRGCEKRAQSDWLLWERKSKMK